MIPHQTGGTAVNPNMTPQQTAQLQAQSSATFTDGQLTPEAQAAMSQHYANATPQNAVPLNQGGGNVYETAANSFNGAVNATNGAMMQNANSAPMMATPAMAGTAHASTSTYRPFTGLNGDGSAMTGFGAVGAGGAGYDATTMGPARDVVAGQFAGTDIAPYMNPYTQNVVDQTAADMERARLVQQNQTNDAMTAAGAFGGSRHGIANAETNRGFYDRLGATTGALRNAGYVNAQQAAFQDIGNNMQADLANQQSDLTTGAFNANAQNEAGRTRANNATSASIANANNASQLAGMRLNAVNDAGRFNAGSANDTSRFNAGNLTDTSRFNAGTLTDTSRFNAGTFNDFQQQRFGNQMAGASQLASLSNLGLNMGNSIADQQRADGAQVRDINQQVMDLAQQQWANYANAGNVGLSQLQSGINSAPSGAGTTTQSSNPGVFGILSAFL